MSKPRKKIIEMILHGGEVSSIVEAENGLLKALDKNGNEIPSEVYHGSGYLRDSGKPKILRSILPANPKKGQNPWKCFDLYIFIDTNSSPFNSKKLFAASSGIGVWEDKKNKKNLVIYHQDILIGTCDLSANPERLAWADIVTRIRKSEFFNEDHEILILTDSEKGLHPQINNKTEPLFEAHYLPKNFTISYATSDAGAESWINKEMKRRDSCASKALKDISSSSLAQKALLEHFYIKNIYDAS